MDPMSSIPWAHPALCGARWGCCWSPGIVLKLHDKTPNPSAPSCRGISGSWVARQPHGFPHMLYVTARVCKEAGMGQGWGQEGDPAAVPAATV